MPLDARWARAENERMQLSRASVALMLTLNSGCASTLASLALGYERGLANLNEREQGGVAYLERKPSPSPHAVQSGTVDVVVMLHGFAGNKDHWTRLCAELPESMWLLAVDLPGNGDSNKDQSISYDLEAQAVRLHQFLHAHFAGTSAGKVHIVGNSLGGDLATVYALAYPDDVKSLVLLAPAGIDPSTQHAIVVKEPKDFDRLIDAAFAHPPEIPGPLRDYFAEQAVLSTPWNQKILDDMAKKPAPIKERIEGLKPPTLVVWGSVDKIIDPSAAVQWRERVPGHLVVILPDTGHGPMVERPSEVASLMLTWWSAQHLL